MTIFHLEILKENVICNIKKIVLMNCVKMNRVYVSIVKVATLPKQK